jgi:hypothetical protein
MRSALFAHHEVIASETVARSGRDIGYSLVSLRRNKIDPTFPRARS